MMNKMGKPDPALKHRARLKDVAHRFAFNPDHCCTDDAGSMPRRFSAGFEKAMYKAESA
jgi:hypothetical protein